MPAPALLFDIGNVLTFFDFVPAAQRFAAKSKISAEEVLALLSPFKDALESGRISSESFVALSMELIGFRGTTADFNTIWCEIFTENKAMTTVLKSLAAKHPLYLLSNTNGLHKDWLFANFDFFSLFQGGIYSHEAGCMKPHDAIFQEAINAYDLDPASTFYIDDLGDNIATGQRLGFASHLYHHDRHATFEAELRQWLNSQRAE